MSTARLVPMPDTELAAWRAARAEAGVPLPEPGPGRLRAAGVEVDGVVVGGALLEDVEEGDRTCFVRVLQTTLPRDATGAWAAVVAALEADARAHGAATLATAVPPELAGVYGAAGFRATLTTVGKRLDPTGELELQEDRRVAVRPMTGPERRRFVGEAREFLLAGMERAGVVDRESSRLAELEERLARLGGDDPPAQELLMTGLVDGRPVGRAWATLMERDGALDFFGNTLDLFPEHRGQGLTRSFLGALRRHVHELGVREVHLRVYGHATDVRQTFLDEGAGIADVHLRKDLRADVHADRR